MHEPQLRTFFPQEVTFGRAASYALLPGIIPRLRSLSFVIARFFFTLSQVFGAAGLIDRRHPCLQPQNIGLYRFRDVLGLAFYGLMQDKKNLNKAAVFIMVITSLALTAGLCFSVLGIFAFRINQVHAQFFGDTTSSPYGDGNNFTSDWAYQFLSEVFGNVGMDFWGGLGTAPPIQHLIFHTMLQEMFSTYSQALLVIAVLMIIYHIVIMVADSARTGQPFGQNFNSVWAPVRLALAIGMLVPISNGYNGAQLIAFQVSNWGSSLATNVWNKALDYDSGKFMGYYQPPEIYDVMRAMWDGYLCVYALDEVGQDFNTKGSIDVEADADSGYNYIYFSSIKKNGYLIFDKVLDKDFCGVIKVPMQISTSGNIGLTNYQIKKITGTPGTPTSSVTNGAGLVYGFFGRHVTNAYYASIDYGSGGIATMASPLASAAAHLLIQDKDKTMGEIIKAYPVYADMQRTMVQKYRLALGMNAAGEYFATGSFPGEATQDSNTIKAILKDGKRFGWAGAGSFMMTIAAVNRTVSDSLARAPQVVALPKTLVNRLASPFKPNATIEDESSDTIQSSEFQTVKEINRVVNEADTWFKQWPITQGLTKAAEPPTSRIRQSEWRQQMDDNSSREQSRRDNDIAGSAASGLFNFFMPGNVADINPLGRIVALGNNLILTAGVLGALAVAAGIFLPNMGLVSIFLSIAAICISSGYTMAVVLPLALLTNFMFAVIEWVISVFEAVVGMPLWCLSFITVDGDGIGGKAMKGVMMLFELMLRPTIIVIATVGSFLIFSASVHFLDKAFGSFLDSYYGTSGVLASAAMMVGSVFMYCLMVYSIGNSSFKIIPTIANNFMRWIDGPNGFSGTMQADVDRLAGAAVLAVAGGAAMKGYQGFKAERKAAADAKKQTAATDRAFNERQFDRQSAESRHQEMMGVIRSNSGNQRVQPPDHDPFDNSGMD